MRIVRGVFFSFLIFCFAFSAFFGFRKIKEKKEVAYTIEYKGVLTLWQIDTFEGGIGSRKQFLLDVSSKFEKENKGVLIMVVSHTKESAENNFNSGIYPDMISYGAGINVKNICEIEGVSNFVGGKIGNKTYGVPWCRGNYVLIENAKSKNDKTVVSMSDYTLPTLALNGLDVPKEYIIKNPMGAYVDFVSNKARFFLGTQRDIVRLDSRGFDYKFTALEDFCDLYQYISVISNGYEKEAYSKKFVSFLVSEKIQKSLDKISMFSPYFDLNHKNEKLNILQNTKIKNTTSVFLGEDIIKEFQNTNYSRDKIKNYLL